MGGGGGQGGQGGQGEGGGAGCRAEPSLRALAWAPTLPSWAPLTNSGGGGRREQRQLLHFSINPRARAPAQLRATLGLSVHPGPVRLPGPHAGHHAGGRRAPADLKTGPLSLLLETLMKDIPHWAARSLTNTWLPAPAFSGTSFSEPEALLSHQGPRLPEEGRQEGGRRGERKAGQEGGRCERREGGWHLSLCHR